MNQFGTFYEKLVTVPADTTLSAGSAVAFITGTGTGVVTCKFRVVTP